MFWSTEDLRTSLFPCVGAMNQRKRRGGVVVGPYMGPEGLSLPHDPSEFNLDTS